jgi:hypothetical protein
MKTPIKAMLLALGLATAFAGAAGTASAETQWQRHHPARVEVNHRLRHETLRIKRARLSGKISGHKARELRAEKRGIRGQERLMASRHGGHITRAERLRLNREENRLSRQIGR